jgi:glucose-1-phosphate cytidylyltransferase
MCLGYRGHMVREYFLNYQECMSNDFTLSDGGKRVELHGSDASDWKITFVDTGLHSNIGQRLLRVKKYLAQDEMFLANYADGLADVPLDAVVRDFARRKLVATFASVRSAQSLHLVSSQEDGLVTSIGPMQRDDVLINGGYFVMRREIFDYIEEGEELVDKPFQRLIGQRLLGTYRHLGFWQAMDTFKDKITLDRMEARGDCPWMLWNREPAVADTGQSLLVASDEEP